MIPVRVDGVIGGPLVAQNLMKLASLELHLRLGAVFFYSFLKLSMVVVGPLLLMTVLRHLGLLVGRLKRKFRCVPLYRWINRSAPSSKPSTVRMWLHLDLGVALLVAVTVL